MYSSPCFLRAPLIARLLSVRRQGTTFSLHCLFISITQFFPAVNIFIRFSIIFRADPLQRKSKKEKGSAEYSGSFDMLLCVSAITLPL